MGKQFDRATSLKEIYPADWAAWSPTRRREEERLHQTMHRARRRREQADTVNDERHARREKQIEAAYEAEKEKARARYHERAK